MGDTIFALASGAPPAAIAVVRISGPCADDAARTLTGHLPQPRRAALRALRNADGALLDRALVLRMPGPASPTGEAVVELHLHGGRAVVAAVLAALAALPGLRAATAGEFTRRALANGRIDLAEAEGLGDLLSAETEAQRRAAMVAVEGRLSQAVRGWTDRLLAIAARIEAALDFSDEDDVRAPVFVADAAALAAEIDALVALPPVERLRDGVRIVLAGPPNAGKSTLLNALAERDAAIVAPIAGTTRDRIEAPVTRDGMAYLLIDTAGLAEDTRDPIEAIGISRAKAALKEADLVLWLGDTPPGEPERSLWLYPRADARPVCDDPARLVVSAEEGPAGIAALWQAIAARAEAMLPPPDAIGLNQRQRTCCAEASAALAAAAREPDLLLAAEQLRIARRALDRVTGRADVEAMLDALFARFCIGK